MQELKDLGMPYEALYAKFEQSVQDAARTWSAKLLEMYPNRAELEAQADVVRARLSANAVEVNAITDHEQKTLVKSPTAEEVVIPADHSLCVLTVGAGKPLMSSDMDSDPTLEKWLGTRTLKSWASVPIVVQGCEAGTVCALETEAPRGWTDADQAALVHAAEQIGNMVNHWYAEADKSIFL